MKLLHTLGAALLGVGVSHARITSETRLADLSSSDLAYAIECAPLRGFPAGTGSSARCAYLTARATSTAQINQVAALSVQSEQQKRTEAGHTQISQWFYGSGDSEGADKSLHADNRHRAQPQLLVQDDTSPRDGTHGAHGTHSTPRGASRTYMSFRSSQEALVPNDQHEGGAARRGSDDHADSGADDDATSSFVELEMGSQSMLPYASGVSKWPTKNIPYCFHGNDWDLLSIFNMIIALRTLNSKTNVNFHPVDCNAHGHKLRLHFTANEACSWVGVVKESATNMNSAVYFASALTSWGMAGDLRHSIPWVPKPAKTHQTLQYDAKRGDHLTAAHELMHTLGFEHMHMRSDRHLFVTVSRNTDTANCAKSTASTFGRYNFESIMHYPPSIGGACVVSHCCCVCSERA